MAMHLTSYLNFDGKCEEAFKFYANCLNGKITQLVTFDSMGPGHVPEGWGHKLMHAQMTVGSQELMGSDAPPDRFERQQGFSMSVHVDQPAEAERIFTALAQNGTVRMPI
jgi:PhnB protein